MATKTAPAAKDVIAVLTGVKKRFAKDDAWVQKMMAGVRGAGMEVPAQAVTANSKRANCWCFTGAVIAEILPPRRSAMTNAEDALYNAVLNAVAQTVRPRKAGYDGAEGDGAVIAWNDARRRTVEDVRAATAATINTLRKGVRKGARA